MKWKIDKSSGSSFVAQLGAWRFLLVRKKGKWYVSGGHGPVHLPEGAAVLKGYRNRSDLLDALQR